ncbi:hypothetical protein ABW286_06740 [Erwinia papayae]|uniref:Uncharacterized protein n=1 Tax=Erwinia papayae TaxID=206499 RepID=A0ABV3MZ73_9GAMM
MNDNGKIAWWLANKDTLKSNVTFPQPHSTLISGMLAMVTSSKKRSLLLF